MTGVTPASYKVAVYLGDLGWWNKPTWAKPLTRIAASGKWSASVATASGDKTALDFAALLVPNGYTSPLLAGDAGFPAKLCANAAAYVIKTRHCDSREFEFSGYIWQVRQASSPEGSGPNHFSKNARDVFVAAKGRLRMKIVKRGGRWYSTEINNETVWGYGKYVFHIASRIDQFDPNVVLGLFTWDDTSLIISTGRSISSSRAGERRATSTHSLSCSPLRRIAPCLALVCDCGERSFFARHRKGSTLFGNARI